MKKIISICFVFVLYLTMSIFNISAAETECDMYTVCDIYNSKTKELKIYGKNNLGQLGVSREKKYYYKEEAISVNDLLPKKEKIISYENLRDNVFVITESNKVYVSGENNLGQIGKSSIKNLDKFQLVSYMKKYKVKKVVADWDSNYNMSILTYIIRNSGEDNIEYVELNKNQKYVYMYTNSLIKNKRTYDYERSYNINNGFLFRKNDSVQLNNNPSYKGKKNKLIYTSNYELKNKNTKRLLRKSIFRTYMNTRGSKNQMKWNTKNVTTYYYKANYNKNNKLTYKVVKKKNSNNKLTYSSYYKVTKKGVIKKLIKNKYYNNTNMYGNKNIKYKVAYTWNKAGQLKSNKNGKAYKVTTKYNKKGKRISKVTYKYNAKGKAKKISRS